MPLGSALKTRIDIDFTRAQGINSSGRIMFYPFRAPIGTTVISSQPIIVEVENGVGTVDLVRMGSVHYYAVREFIDGRPEYNSKIMLPYDAPDVVRYESLAEAVPVPLVYTVVAKVNGISPDPVTGNVTVPAGQGPKGEDGDDGEDGTDGADGTNGTNGTDGVDGRDGILKAFTRTVSTIEVWGPCGDGGDWTMCPPSYRSVPIPADPGDKLQWCPPFLHQNSQEAAFDIASVIDGEVARCLSSGTSTPLGGGWAGLYMQSGQPRSLSPQWYSVTADDIDADGKVTLALMYRNNGSGNMMGNAFVPGYVDVINAGPGGSL